MYMYTKEQKRLLIDLINEANPGLNLAPLALDTARLGVPWSRTPEEGEIADTSVEVYPRDNTFFIGKVIVHYRRLDVAKLFAHKVLRFDRWREGDVTTEDLVTWINERYQTQFVIEDFGTASWPSYSGNRTRNISNTSLCYQGTLTFKWERGKRELDQIIQTNDFDGRYWDERHGGAEDSRPLLMLTGYGADYTDLYSNIKQLSNGRVIDGSEGNLRVVLQRYNELYGTELSASTEHTVANGLKGLTITRVSLPSLSVPEANADEFGHAMIITSQADSWFGGRLIFHYNTVAVDMAEEVFSGLAIRPTFYVKTPGLAEDTTLNWSLTERDGLIPSEDLSRLTGSFITRRLPSTIHVDEALSPEDVEGYNVRAEVRRTNNVLLAVSDYSRVIPDVVIKPSTSTIRYDEEISFDITQTSFESDTTIAWTAEPIEGEFTEPVTGTFVPTAETATLTIAIPETKASVLGTKWRLVLREGSSTGKVLGRSNTVEMDDVYGIQESTANSSIIVPELATRVKIRLGAAGGGGGGTQQYRDGNGGRGGNGGEIVIDLDVLGGERIAWNIGRGGDVGEIWSRSSGGRGGNSTVAMDDVELGEAEGGQGGAPGGSTNGANGAPGGNGQGGLGGRGTYNKSDSAIDYLGDDGDDGYITVEWFGW